MGNRGAVRRFADRLRVPGVGLVPLHKRLDVLRRHQLDPVALRLEPARPMVRAATGFHPDQARRQLRKIIDDVFTLQLLAQHGLALRIRSVRLKNMLCQIQTHYAKIFHGRLLSCSVVINTFHFGTFDAVRDGEASISLTYIEFDFEIGR